jgi:hypothetical protein
MPLGPFTWRVRVLRASPGSVVTETTAHLRDDQGRSRCGVHYTPNSKPAPISAARCPDCADTDIWRDPAAAIERLRASANFDTPMALDAEAWEEYE